MGDSYREKRVGPTASKAMRVRNRGMKRCELTKEQWERVKAVLPLSCIVRRWDMENLSLDTACIKVYESDL